MNIKNRSILTALLIGVFVSNSALVKADEVVKAPRCLDGEYPGVIKNDGEFIITLDGKEKVTRLEDITKALNSATTKTSGISWKYTADSPGNIYFSAKFESWRYRGMNMPKDEIYIAEV